MNAMVTVFDAFYTRLVLRDFFGKIVPGQVLLWTIVMSATSPATVATYVKGMSSWAWIAAFGISWVPAFAVQSFAEKPFPGKHSFKFIRYYPKNLDETTARDMRLRFDRNASPDEKQQLERLVVIKEACGNSYVAFAISLPLVAYELFNSIAINRWLLVPLLILAVAAIYYLAQMHLIHVQRQHDYMVTALKLHEKSVQASG